jgi:DNA-binding response OmpR family regulator
MSFKILVVDDNINNESDDISGLPTLLQAAGYDVVITADGEAAYDLVWECNPDLIVLDNALGIPDISGIDICQAIREEGSNVPTILITAVMTETEDVLRGFEAGADDYVVRPRDLREVLARIRANLPPQVIVIDDYVQIDFVTRQVWVKREEGWQEVHFQPLQFDLLHTLVVNAGLILPATTIKDRVWGKVVSDGVLAVYIRRLREKLESDPGQPMYAETITGLGYRFNGRPARVGRSEVNQKRYRG